MAQVWNRFARANNESGRKVTARGVSDLLKQQDFRCALSGVPITPELAEGDHKVARVMRGQSGIENFQWVHEIVHRMKGTMSNEEFIEWCRRVVAYADAPGPNSSQQQHADAQRKLF